MKRNRRFFYSAIFAVCVSFFAKGQQNIPLGHWRTHFNYRQSYEVATVGGKVYSSAGNALLEVDPRASAISTLSKTNRLSDVNITAVDAHPPTSTLLVGYANGNIDLLRESVTYNVTGLMQSGITSSKKINDIFSSPESFFVCTGFGMLEINLSSLEIINTFEELGRNGKQIGILNGTVAGDSIFLASEEGILSASLQSGLNLLDFRNWNRALETEGVFDFIAASETVAYAAKRNGRLWVNHGDGWVELAPEGPISFLTLQNDELLFGAGNLLLRRTPTETPTALTLPASVSVTSAINMDGSLWIGDENNGLARITGTEPSYFVSAGPLEKNIYRIRQSGSTIFSMSGGFDKNSLLPFNRPASVSVFGSEGWMPSFVSTDYNNASDVVSTGPANYILLNGHGIYDQSSARLIDDTEPGSMLQRTNGLVPVTAFIAGAEGELIISSNQAGAKYFIRDAEGSWSPLSFIPESVPPSVSMHLNSYGDVWGILPGNAGVLVFNAETRQYKLITAGSGLPSSYVNGLAFDRDDYAWLATDRGLAIIANTYEVFEPVSLIVTYAVAGNSFVLDDEVINSVKVDGANRKWIGTQRGLFLLDEFGEGTLTHFNRQNSPILSNEVQQLEINPETGEIFILTSAGLVSYRAEAIKPVTTMAKLKIFPNPVKPGYGGLLSIEGLPFDCVVKITDEAGRLVREMVSYGGRATWDLRDYTGRRAASGVYIVFAASRNGSQSVAGKVAIIE